MSATELTEEVLTMRRDIVVEEIAFLSNRLTFLQGRLDVLDLLLAPDSILSIPPEEE